MLSTVSLRLQLHHLPEGLWVGKILLAFSRRQLISGIKYGKKRDVLHLEFFFRSRKIQKPDTNMRNVGKILCYRKKLALLCGRKNKKRLWSEIRRLNHSRLNLPPIVDGVSGSRNIANLFASKSEDVLNTHPTSTHSLLQTSVTDFCINEVCFSEDDVLQALSQLKGFVGVYKG